MVDNLKKTRFHIWEITDVENEDTDYTLEEWLLENHGMDITDCIKRYEGYVEKGFETVRQWENKHKKNKNFYLKSIDKKKPKFKFW